jgi:hypothetical protein
VILTLRARSIADGFFCLLAALATGIASPMMKRAVRASSLVTESGQQPSFPKAKHAACAVTRVQDGWNGLRRRYGDTM